MLPFSSPRCVHFGKHTVSCLCADKDIFFWRRTSKAFHSSHSLMLIISYQDDVNPHHSIKSNQQIWSSEAAPCQEPFFRSSGCCRSIASVSSVNLIPVPKYALKHIATPIVNEPQQQRRYTVVPNIFRTRPCLKRCPSKLDDQAWPDGVLPALFHLSPALIRYARIYQYVLQEVSRPYG